MDSHKNIGSHSGAEASQLIEDRRTTIVAALVARQYELQPELMARYTPRQHARFMEDSNYHLLFLGEAVAAERPTLFTDYIAWARVLLAGVGVPVHDLVVSLEVLRDVLTVTLRDEVPEGVFDLAAQCIDAALSQLPGLPTTVPSFIQDQDPHAEMASQYLDALLGGDRRRATQMVMDAATAGMRVQDIYLDVFQRSQREIGRLWQTRQISVAQEHYCSASTQLIMSQLYPYICAGEKNGRKMIAACIGGDLHEIGLRMVADFFEIDGWETFYLGANTPGGAIMEMLAVEKAELLALSATMTYNIRAVADLIKAVRATPDIAGVTIMVGGYPFNVAPDLWRTVGADAYVADASLALALLHDPIVGAR